MTLQQKRNAPALVLLAVVLGFPAGAREKLNEARKSYERSQSPEITLQERRDWLEKSLAAYPTYKASYDLGKLQRKAGRFEDALASFEAAYGLTDQDAYLARAAYQIGATHHGLGRFVEARRWLRRSLGRHDHPAVRSALRDLELSRKHRIVSSEEILREFAVERSFGVARAEMRVSFELNEASLDETGQRQAAELGRALTDPEGPDGTLLLLGHTDRLCPRSSPDGPGCDGFNLDLSSRRAATVREFLAVRYGLTDIVALGCGRRHPLSRQSSEDDHYLNRRVVVMVLDRPRDDADRLCGDDAGLL